MSPVRIRNWPAVKISFIVDPTSQIVKRLATSEKQNCGTVVADSDPIGQRQCDGAEQIGVDVEQQDDNADIRSPSSSCSRI